MNSRFRFANAFAWAVFAICLTGGVTRGDNPRIVFGGGEGLGKGKHVVLVSGDEEYRSEEALPQLAKILSQHQGFKCTVLFAIDKTTGEVNPKQIDNIPGLEALKTADLMIIFTRFRNLPDDQMQHVVDYVDSGRPVIGLRTATHAFALGGQSKFLHYTWTSKQADWDGGFGRQVLGETWINHHGSHGSQSTRGIIAEGMKGHPILRGIADGDVWGPTDVYTVRLPLPGDSKPLVMGQVLTGMKPDDKPLEGEKNNPMMPVAWVKTFTGKSGKTARVFTTTMGASQDLEREGTRRMIVNACFWALGMEDKIPEKTNVDIVGDYKPTRFAFDGFVRGKKPADFATGGRAVETEWKVGLANAKITPEQPVMMAGYDARKRPFDKVEADLYVKALFLQDNAGHKGVIVTSDLIGFPAALAEPICERIQKKTGLKREQILISSSHTHTGPEVRLDAQPKDGRDEGQTARTIEYTRQLQDKVVDVVVQAAGRLEPAELTWGSGVAHFVMNRREFTPDRVILGVNPRGLADRSVPVLKVAGADGTTRAILFGAGVHGTTLNQDCFEICGDYAGFAQALVQERLPGVQAMFILGCAGDANPYPRGTMTMARQHGMALGEEVIRVLGGKLVPVRGPLEVAFGNADLPLDTTLSRAELQTLAANRRDIRSAGAAQMLATLDRGEKVPTHYKCPIAVWQFGQDLTLVGLPGEVVVDYLTFLEKALGPNRLWVAAYCNDVFGYVPSARILAEGGYETRGLYTGGYGFFHPDVEKVFVRAIRDLAIKAGRKTPD